MLNLMAKLSAMLFFMAILLASTINLMAQDAPTQDLAAPQGTIIALGDDDNRLILNQGESTQIQFKARLINGKQPMTVKWEILGFVDPSLSITTDGSNTDILRVNAKGAQLGSYGVALQAILTLKSGKKIKLGNNFIFDVRQEPNNEDFRLKLNPSNIVLTTGTSQNISVTVEGLNGFNAGVVLSASNKEGLDFQFRDQFVLPNTSTDLLITASTNLSEVTTTVQITGITGITTRTALLQVQIKKPVVAPDPIIDRVGRDECHRKRLPDANLGLYTFKFTAKNFIPGRHRWFLSKDGSYYSHPFAQDPKIDPDTGLFTANIVSNGFAEITIHITDSQTNPPNLSKDSAPFEFVSKLKLLQEFPVTISNSKIQDGGSQTVKWSAPNPGGRTLIYLMNEDCDHPDQAHIQGFALLVLENGGKEATVEVKAPPLCLECNRLRYRIRVQVTDPSAPGTSMPGIEPAANGAFQGTSDIFEIVPRF